MSVGEQTRTFADRTGIIFVFLACFNTAVHLITANNLEYHRDELLYFSLGLHPAFGYNTVPPFTGWLAWFVQNIFGYSVVAVKLVPAIAGGFMVILVSEISRELGGSAYSRVLSAVGLIISVYAMRTFHLFQPVFTDIILWTTIFWLVIKYKNTGAEKYLIFLGVCGGLALLNKYLIGVLIAVLAVTVLFTPDRQIYGKKGFWIGVLAGTIIFLPNLIWQFSNQLPVLDHIVELNRTQLNYVDRGAFLFEQLLLPGFASVLTVTGLIYLLIGRDTWKFRFMGVAVLSVVFVLMLLKGKSYYTLGIFPFLTAAGAVSFEKMIHRRWLRVLFPLILVLFTLPMVPVGLPVYKTAGLVEYFSRLKESHGPEFITRFEDGTFHSLPQDYADMLGWEELTLLTDKAWQMIPDKESALIYCENYGHAGAVTVIGRKYGLPFPVSFHESFKYWIPDQFENEIEAGIYINSELGDDVRALFGKITRVGSISDPHAREYGTAVYLCEEPSVSFNAFWSEIIKQVR